MADLITCSTSWKMERSEADNHEDLIDSEDQHWRESIIQEEKNMKERHSM